MLANRAQERVLRRSVRTQVSVRGEKPAARARAAVRAARAQVREPRAQPHRERARRLRRVQASAHDRPDREPDKLHVRAVGSGKETHVPGCGVREHRHVREHRQTARRNGGNVLGQGDDAGRRSRGHVQGREFAENRQERDVAIRGGNRRFRFGVG